MKWIEEKQWQTKKTGMLGLKMTEGLAWTSAPVRLNVWKLVGALLVPRSECQKSRGIAPARPGGHESRRTSFPPWKSMEQESPHVHETNPIIMHLILHWYCIKRAHTNVHIVYIIVYIHIYYTYHVHCPNICLSVWPSYLISSHLTYLIFSILFNITEGSF